MEYHQFYANDVPGNNNTAPVEDPAAANDNYLKLKALNSNFCLAEVFIYITVAVIAIAKSQFSLDRYANITIGIFSVCFMCQLWGESVD